jgi:hypothetical protein
MGFQVMGMAALSAFEMANETIGRQAYEVHVLSERGGPVRSSPGFAVDTAAFGTDVFDTTVTIGSLTIEPSSPGLLDYLRTDGRRASMHWGYAQTLQHLYPAVKVDMDRLQRRWEHMDLGGHERRYRSGARPRRGRFRAGDREVRRPQARRLPAPHRGEDSRSFRHFSIWSPSRTGCGLNPPRPASGRGRPVVRLRRHVCFPPHSDE